MRDGSRKRKASCNGNGFFLTLLLFLFHLLSQSQGHGFGFLAVPTSAASSKPISLRCQLATAISSALGSVTVVEDFGDNEFPVPKTREFTEALRRWGIDPKEKSMFLMTEVADNVKLSSRNIGTLRMLTPRTLNLFDILKSDKLVLTPAAVDYLNSRYGTNVEDEDDAEEEEEEEESVLESKTALA